NAAGRPWSPPAATGGTPRALPVPDEEGRVPVSPIRVAVTSGSVSGRSRTPPESSRRPWLTPAPQNTTGTGLEPGEGDSTTTVVPAGSSGSTCARERSAPAWLPTSALT